MSTSHYSLLCCTVRARTMSSHQPFSNTRPLLTTHDRDYLSCSISPLLRGWHHTNSGTCNYHWTVTDTVTSNHYTFRIPFLPLELEISIDYLHSHLTISLHIMSTNLTQPDRIHFSLAATHYGFLTDYLTISLFTWHCTTIQDTFFLTRPQSQIFTTTQTPSLLTAISTMAITERRTPQHHTTDRTSQLSPPRPYHRMDYIHYRQDNTRHIHTVTFERLSSAALTNNTHSELSYICPRISHSDTNEFTSPRIHFSYTSYTIDLVFHIMATMTRKA